MSERGGNRLANALAVYLFATFLFVVSRPRFAFDSDGRPAAFGVRRPRPDGAVETGVFAPIVVAPTLAAVAMAVAVAPALVLPGRFAPRANSGPT